MFQNNNIKKRIWGVVKEKINSAQDEYDAFCFLADDNAEKRIEEIRTEAETAKDDKADELVSGFLAKCRLFVWLHT